MKEGTKLSFCENCNMYTTLRKAIINQYPRWLCRRCIANVIDRTPQKVYTKMGFDYFIPKREGE